MGKNIKKNYVGIDLGGTKILTLLLDKKFDICAKSKESVDANKGAKKYIESIVSTVEDVLDKTKTSMKSVVAIGVGCPGMIELPQGIVRLSPNINFFKNYPLKAILRRRFKRPVIIENDVNAGLFGEHHFGAAIGYSNIVGIFPGTGIGGALILNGELFRGSTGAAGEIGHTFLSLDILGSNQDSRSTVETMVGRLAIASEAAFLAMRQKTPNLFKLAGTDLRKMKSGVLADAINAGDEALKELILYKSRVLGISMANIVNILNPELIVLGGGIIEAMGNIIIPEARRTMKKYALKPVVANVKVLPAHLKDYSVGMGAAKLARDSIEHKKKK